MKHAATLQEAMGMLPSIGDPQRSSTPARVPVPKARARKLFMSSLGGKPYRVQDKTRLRYVLYRAEPDPEVLKLVCGLASHHPEHADAFFAYLARFPPRKPITRLCLELIDKSPYAYMRGEAWLNLSGQLQGKHPLDAPTRAGLVRRAIRIAKKKRPENFTETQGACHFLAIAEVVEGKRYSRFLKFQPALLQAFVSEVLPDTAFAVDGAAEAYLKRSAFEPGISICARVHAMGLGPATFGIRPSALPSQVRNTMKALGTIPVRGGPVDPIAELIEARYEVSSAPKSWHTLLGQDYAHALGLLKLAEAAFKSSFSYWLANQNSFHHAIFLALQRHLNATGHAAARSFKNKNGELLDFGVMLDANSPFSKACPVIADCFRDMNNRRNRLPNSHPYDKKSAAPSRHLTARERNRFVHALKAALPVFVGLMP